MRVSALIASLAASNRALTALYQEAVHTTGNSAPDLAARYQAAWEAWMQLRGLSGDVFAVRLGFPKAINKNGG